MKEREVEENLLQLPIYLSLEYRVNNHVHHINAKLHKHQAHKFGFKIEIDDFIHVLFHSSNRHPSSHQQKKRKNIFERVSSERAVVKTSMEKC